VDMGSDGDAADAVRDTEGGATIDVMVTPNASRPGLQGYNQWRRRLEFRVAAEAKRSKANSELVATVAELLDIPLRDVTIVRGERSHEKTVRVEGAARDDVVSILVKALGGVRG
jgi:uncharacterized protein (TIGR00251 family)